MQVFLAYLALFADIEHSFVKVCLLVSLATGICGGFLVLPCIELLRKYEYEPYTIVPEDRLRLLDDADLDVNDEFIPRSL